MLVRVTRWNAAWLFALGAASSGCSSSGSPDAAPADTGSFDTRAADSGPRDAGPRDAGRADSGLPDAGLRVCPVGMIFLPGGTITRRSPLGVVTEVTVRAHCLDRTEVTATAYATCVAAGRCAPAGMGLAATGGVAGLESHPINYVSFVDATTYCGRRGARLPTQAEWEYAASPDGRTYPWGEAEPSATLLNVCARECFFPSFFSYADPFPRTAPVGSFPAGASPFGVLDLWGNVWEWTSDVWESYPVPLPTDGMYRVLRGGGWDNDLEAGSVLRGAVTDRGEAFGFRCARGA